MKVKNEKQFIYCNQCGQPIANKNLPKSDYIKVRKIWGYFSNKDMQIHEFNICESCYDNMIKNFKIKPVIKKNNEAM